MAAYNRYGWKRDKPDFRDFKYVPKVVSLPEKVDLRPGCPTVYDQQALGSGVGQALAGCFHYELIKRDRRVFQPSAMFIYYNARVIGNGVLEDCGVEIRDAIKGMFRWGVCPEQYYPYVIKSFTKKPQQLAYGQALKHRVSRYERVSPHDLKSCLAEGKPFVFGFTAYQSFETGVLNMPVAGDKDLGGQAALAVGYDDSISRFIVRNSFGHGWGSDGYFTMPYEYVELCADFWTITFEN